MGVAEPRGLRDGQCAIRTSVPPGELRDDDCELVSCTDHSPFTMRVVAIFVGAKDVGFVGKRGAAREGIYAER